MSTFKPIPSGHLWVLPLLVLCAGACTDGPSEGPDHGTTLGAEEFFSADGTEDGWGVAQTSAGDKNASDADGNVDEEALDVGGEAGMEPRTVEEGDIYRVLENDLILNLNAYRGLQVVDFSDVQNPFIAGRLRVAGTPVEMYVVENRAVVLLNNWRGYYGSRDDLTVDSREGGLVLLVDLSDPSAPVLLDQTYISGHIRTSRLTRGGAQSALYVAAELMPEIETTYYAGGIAAMATSDGGAETVVKSFDVSGSTLIEVTELNLGGYVSDIQATTEALMVARQNWDEGNFSTVALVDISNPNGAMVLGDEVQVQGMVRNKYNMDLYNGVLRIVSSSSWDSSNANHLETFDASDFSNLAPLDHCAFGEGQDLYATLFLGNKAFFVTYFRKDPFHAFSVDDEGQCNERSEFVVSGWNDYFTAVLDEERLVGIGTNDEEENTMAVSLYDITELSNPNPLVARAEVAADSSWSEASYDDRAFSVLEGAVSVNAPDGTTETGLVLLPFQGWNAAGQKYVAAVQIYTFSKNTLTRRGVMTHDSQVRRSFLADDTTTANLSETSLRFYNHTSPDSPQALGSLVLAPDYSDIFAFGEYAVRIDSTHACYTGGALSIEESGATAEVISLNEDPDSATSLASFAVPAGAHFVKAGDKLVGLAEIVKQAPDGSESEYLTKIDIFDLSDPLSPTRAGSLTAEGLGPDWERYGMPEMDWGYGMGYMCQGGDYIYWIADKILPFDGGIAVLQTETMDDKTGIIRQCYERPRYESMGDYDMVDEDSPSDLGDMSNGSGADDDVITSVEGDDEAIPQEHIDYGGSINCTSINGGEEYCTGEIVKCLTTWEGDEPINVECEPANLDEIETERECYEQELYRYWQVYTLHTIDLTGAEPQLASPIQMPSNEEGVAVLSSGSSLYYSYKKPYSVEGDSKPYARYYFKEIDLTKPSSPVIGNPVNVPGELLKVQGNTVYTRDLLWNQEGVQETAVNKLEVSEGRARRVAAYRFEGRYVEEVSIDTNGNLLVNHRQAWNDYDIRIMEEAEPERLTVLDNGLAELSTIDIDYWATFKGAQSGRALFSVSGGLLIVNVTNPAAPFAQAYFPTQGWPEDIVVSGNKILMAAGPYGLYSLDADTFNLLPSNDLSD